MNRGGQILSVLFSVIILGFITPGCVRLRPGTHHYNKYDPLLPLKVTIHTKEERPEYIRLKLAFDGLAGERVPTLFAQPRESVGPLPAVIFLHGMGQKKEFLDEIAKPFVKAGFILVSFDQHTRGERKQEGLNRLEKLIALRRRAVLNVIETRRLIDYLQTRPDIAPNRIYLLGASFGAITGCTAAAFDDRISATILTYGAGNFRLLFSSKEASETFGIWLWPIKPILIFFLTPTDPIRYVKRISPRPVLFQNGRYDSLIPVVAAQALFNAAQEPKEIIWYDSNHIGQDPKHLKQVLNDAIEWLKKQDARIEGREG